MIERSDLRRFVLAMLSSAVVGAIMGDESDAAAAGGEPGVSLGEQAAQGCDTFTQFESFNEGGVRFQEFESCAPTPPFNEFTEEFFQVVEPPIPIPDVPIPGVPGPGVPGPGTPPGDPSPI